MTLLNIAKQIIIEGKQVGILYHYTNLEALIDIIESNSLLSNYSQGGGRHKDQKGPYVCFTRNKNALFSISMDSEVLIEIDGDKLSNNYKIIPFQDYDYDGTPADEYEERVYKNIDNLKKYILNIVIYKKRVYDKETYKECISILKNSRIPYKLI